ncbi:MAG: dTDP-4-dehydrorhamnose reductase [bacterium]
MRILITGGRGLLGSEITKTFDSHGFDTVSIGTKEADITKRNEINRIIPFYKPEVIIHAAAYTFVDECERNKELAFRVNAVGTQNVAEAAELIGAALVYMSTDYVFDGNAASPYTEEDVPNPLNVYGASKLEGERLAAGASSRCCIIRSSWLFGKNGRNFVDTMREQLHRGNDRVLTVVNDQRGSPTYAVHLADALLQVVNNVTGESPAPPGIFHITASGECTWYEFARRIAELLGMQVDILPVSSGDFRRDATRPNYSVLDNSKAQRLFGITMPHWEDGLKEYIGLK